KPDDAAADQASNEADRFGSAVVLATGWDALISDGHVRGGGVLGGSVLGWGSILVGGVFPGRVARGVGGVGVAGRGGAGRGVAGRGVAGWGVKEESRSRQGNDSHRESEKSGSPQADLSAPRSNHTELLFPVRNEQVLWDPSSRSVPKSIF